MKILMYVLHGMWNTEYDDGCFVVKVSADPEVLEKELEKIADSHAGEYVKIPDNNVTQKREKRYYSISANFIFADAEFRITEQYVELPETAVWDIAREAEKADRTNDITEYLQGLYESGNMEAWKYEYVKAVPEVTEKIRLKFEEYEDCNVPFNVTMENAADEVLKELTLNDEMLEFFREKFISILTDDAECISDDFLGFPAGTYREEICQWFDSRYSGDVDKLTERMERMLSSDKENVDFSVY